MRKPIFIAALASAAIALSACSSGNDAAKTSEADTTAMEGSTDTGGMGMESGTMGDATSATDSTTMGAMPSDGTMSGGEMSGDTASGTPSGTSSSGTNQ